MALLVQLGPFIALTAVMLIELYGHIRKREWIADIAVPLGGFDEELPFAVPEPLPHDLRDGSALMMQSANRIAFEPALHREAMAACFGVVTFRRAGENTIARYQRKAPAWMLAGIAFMSSGIWQYTGELAFAALTAGFVTPIFAIAFLIHARRTRRRYDEIIAGLRETYGRSAPAQRVKP